MRQTNGNFIAVLALDTDMAELRPAMNCTAKVPVYEKADALLVPTAAVQREEPDSDQGNVYLVAGKDKPVKRGKARQDDGHQDRGARGTQGRRHDPRQAGGGMTMRRHILVGVTALGLLFLPGLGSRLRDHGTSEPGATAAPPEPPAEPKPPEREVNYHPPEPKAVPPEELEASIARGVEFLVKDQNEDGSWGSAERTKA